jgi:EAL domain-containing protein (putative c-di-GMP-specific phosphodiesterase class I)
MSSSGSLSGRAPSLAQTAALVERLTMEADLRHALAAGDLVLRYQPIVDLVTGRIIAFETLCRWRHWSRGLLGPAHFLPLAEETGLITAVGTWVLEESTRRLALWRGRMAEAADLDVTVNLSGKELRDRGLVDRAAHALDVAGLPAERLVVEVSEAAAYADPQAGAVRNLRALTDLGVGLAVDDIGAPRPGRRSGRPDLDGWLWDLPVRLLKVDRGVVARLEDDAVSDRAGSPAAGGGDASPCRALRVLADAVGLASARGALAVAKGVETADHLAGLYRLGCPAGQGFLFARPMDPADAEAYLRRLVRTRASALA